jgi:RNA polymerase sigma-70 factor (ECF subfamily)
MEDKAGGVTLQKHSEDADDRALVEAAKRDPARFAEVYDRHFERVYAFIARRIGRREEVQDLTADVFHQALAGIGRFQWRGAPFAAWLLRIAANAITDRGRRLARESGQPALDVEEIQPESNPIEEVEERARLFRLVHSLPTDQRCVILKRFVEQRSIRQIAEQLGRTDGAVKQLQFRALKNLRARLEDANG